MELHIRRKFNRRQAERGASDKVHQRIFPQDGLVETKPAKRRVAVPSECNLTSERAMSQDGAGERSTGVRRAGSNNTDGGIHSETESIRFRIKY
jgi:hypothetical protein